MRRSWQRRRGGVRWRRGRGRGEKQDWQPGKVIEQGEQQAQEEPQCQKEVKEQKQKPGKEQEPGW